LKSRKGVISALILAISVISLARFTLGYWRATFIQAGSQTVSDEVRAAAQLKRATISGEDFAALRGVHSLTPGGAGGVGLVTAYYGIVKAVEALAGRHAAVSAWAKQEMATCACYVGVQIDRRLRLSMAPLGAAL
jgi:hypothetical protein